MNTRFGTIFVLLVPVK